MNSKQLTELGIAPKDVTEIISTITKAAQNFRNRGFNVQDQNAFDFFVSQYQKAKATNAKDPRKAAFSALQRAKFPPINKTAKVPRNAICPCGSGAKYKKCCINKKP